MPLINYGIFCEDAAQSIFVENLLAKMKTENIEFFKNEDFRRKFGVSRSKSEVLATYLNVSKSAFAYYDINILFIGMDLDDKQSEFDTFMGKLSSETSEYLKEYSKNVIIFIPVQCIETWCWYLKKHKQNPKSTKNENLEKHKCRYVKSKFYKSKLTNDRINEIQEITENININWLISRSHSFNHFYEKLKGYMLDNTE